MRDEPDGIFNMSRIIFFSLGFTLSAVVWIPVGFFLAPAFWWLEPFRVLLIGG